MYGYIHDLINVFGGLAVFLYGVEQCSAFFKDSLDPGMRGAMMRLTGRDLHSFMLGAALSAVTQSSTIATSFAVGFVDAGMMSFAGALWLMMGASLGGTFVSFLLGLNLFVYAPLMFGVSFFLGRSSNRKVSFVFGLFRCLSLIFLGMLILGSGTGPIFSDPLFREAAAGWASNLIVMWGFAFISAGVLQSSSAVMALGLALCAADALPPQPALALALGAHMGSSTMVVLAGMSGGLSARRLGLATFIFKLSGGALFAPLIPAVHALFSTAGIGISQELVYGQVLIAAFNILIFLPFPELLMRITARLVHSSGDPGEPRYLNDSLLADPVLAVMLLSRELCRLAGFIEAYLQMLLEPEQRDARLFALLPDAISRLCESCQEFTYRLNVPLSDARLRGDLAVASYAISNMRGMTKLLCGTIRYNLESVQMHADMTGRLGEGLWRRWRKLARSCLRDSFRAFVIGEKGLVSSVRLQEEEMLLLGARIRRVLGEQDAGYDRSAARAVRLVSLMQGFIAMAKELAEGEEFVTERLKREMKSGNSGRTV